MAQISISTRKLQIFKGKNVLNIEHLPYKAKLFMHFNTLKVIVHAKIFQFTGVFLSVRGIADSVVSSELFHIDINDREPFIPTTASGF